MLYYIWFQPRCSFALQAVLLVFLIFLARCLFAQAYFQVFLSCLLVAQHVHFVVNPLVDTIFERSVVEFVIEVPTTDATQPIYFDNVIDQAFEREARFDTCHPRVTDCRLFRIAAMNEQLRPHPADECEVGWLRRNHRIPFTLVVPKLFDA